jgi:hypothetical protein
VTGEAVNVSRLLCREPVTGEVVNVSRLLCCELGTWAHGT